MPSDLEILISNLEKFSWHDELQSIVDDNKEVINEMQAEQLDKGLDRYGTDITLEGNGYSPFTVSMKMIAGQPYDRVTWHDTGDLHASFKTIVQGDEFEVTSPSFKFGKMIERSGPDAVGLDEEYRKEFAEIVTLPEIKERLYEKTGLKF